VRIVRHERPGFDARDTAAPVKASGMFIDILVFVDTLEIDVHDPILERVPLHVLANGACV